MITNSESTVVAKTGEIKITWEAPDSNGSEIQGFKVEIENNEGEWITKCSTTDILKCKLRMTELRDKFNLKLG